MTILAPYHKLLNAMEQALRTFESRLSKPEFVRRGPNNEAARLPKQDIEHAIFLKLVMIASGLDAAMILHRHGHTFEQGALSRMVDEANEDVIFLAFGILKQDHTPRHDQFLEEFWAEEWSDPKNVIGSHRPRNPVPRDKISAYNARHHGGDWSTGHKTTMFLARAYSGFVHGAAQHLMDLYHEGTETFSVRGMLGTPRIIGAREDLWNYVYRGGLSFGFAAAAFGSQEQLDLMKQHLETFEAETRSPEEGRKAE
jgi:hypothetical protein